jgi:DNA-binding response OmpR family regulator
MMLMNSPALATVTPVPEEHHILLVEDDTATRLLLSQYLKDNGFSVIEASSLASATKALSAMRFSAVIIDLQLEDGDGLEILRSGISAPDLAIVISSRREPMDRVKGLQLGADDYLPKPIEPHELLLRLKRSLKRKAGHSLETSMIVDKDNGVILDLLERALYKKSELVAALTNKEFRVLKLLLANKDNVVSRELISTKVLGRRVVGQSRSVDMLVSSVRRKLVKCNTRLTLRSIRGEGYALSGRKN